MSDRSLPGLSGGALFALTAGLAGFVAAAFAPQLFNDSDTYWHISAGAWMLDHHAVLRADPFAFTVAGAPWNAQEWLSEILMALAWRAGGWAGVHLLFGLAAGAACAILGFALRRRLSHEAALVALVLGIGCMAGSLLARPHLLALPVLALWTAGLTQARDQGRLPSPWLLILMPLWANLHASFLFGLALTAAFGVEAAVETPSRPVIGGWLRFTVIAVTLSLLTPQGWDGLLFPFQLMAMESMRHIGEWQSANFASLSTFEIALLAVFFFFATRGVKLPVIRTIIFLGLVHFSLAHSRYEMLAGIAGPLLLAGPLGKSFVPAKASGAGISTPFAIAAALLFAVLVAARLAMPVTRGDDAVSPVAALSQVSPSLRATPVLNDYAFGGYLIFSGLHPFIDSRADLYGDRFLNDYAAIQSPDRDHLQAALARYHIGWTMLAADSPANGILDTLPGWHRLYRDSVAAIYVRERLL